MQQGDRGQAFRKRPEGWGHVRCGVRRGGGGTLSGCGLGLVGGSECLSLPWWHQHTYQDVVAPVLAPRGLCFLTSMCPRHALPTLGNTFPSLLTPRPSLKLGSWVASHTLCFPEPMPIPRAPQESQSLSITGAHHLPAAAPVDGLWLQDSLAFEAPPLPKCKLVTQVLNWTLACTLDCLDAVSRPSGLNGHL